MDIVDEIDALKERVHRRLLLEATTDAKKTKRRERMRRYYKANREKILEKNREYYLKRKRSLRLRLRDIPQDRLDEIYRKWCNQV